LQPFRPAAAILTAAAICFVSGSTGTTLKTTYLDDFKGQLSLTYVPFADYRLEVRSTFEQTEDQYRVRSYANHRAKLGSLGLDWNIELDRGDGSFDAAGVDLGYLWGYGRARLSLPLSPQTSVWARLKSDLVRFDSAREGASNYVRLGGQLGIQKYFDNFSSMSGNLFYVARDVSASTSDDYSSLGIEGYWLGFYGGGEADVITSLEIRDYDASGDLDDYLRAELTARNRHHLGTSTFLREELEIELIRFDTTEYLVKDYFRLETALLFGLERRPYSIAAGPHLETFSESQASDYILGEDFVEPAVEVEFEVLLPGRLFGSLESVTGHRNLTDEGGADDFYSDFAFERINLLVDWKIVAGLSLNMILSGDWEWHKQSDENSRLFLTSSNLIYTF
jgi:hypothetical protein